MELVITWSKIAGVVEFFQDLWTQLLSVNSLTIHYSQFIVVLGSSQISHNDI